MPSDFSPDKFIHLYDELAESQPCLPTRAYYKHLVKWGTSPQKADDLIKQFDPNNTGYICRNDICRIVNFDSHRMRALKEVKFLTTDMTNTQRDSVAMLMIEIASQNISKQTMLKQMKERLETVYGGEWSCFMTEGRYWSVCDHKPGTNLVFSYRKMVYGACDTPVSK